MQPVLIQHTSLLGHLLSLPAIAVALIIGYLVSRIRIQYWQIIQLNDRCKKLEKEREIIENAIGTLQMMVENICKGDNKDKLESFYEYRQGLEADWAKQIMTKE